MTRMFFSSGGCQGVDTNTSSYNADRSGFITVTDSADAKALKAGGWVQAGGMPRLGKYFICDGCGWEAAIRSCPKCHGDSFTRVEK